MKDVNPMKIDIQGIIRDYSNKFCIYVGLECLFLVLFGCRDSYNLMDREKANYYIGINLNNATDVHFFEYELMQGYTYPKCIYIKLEYPHPEGLLKQLNLLPSRFSLNTDTTRDFDYSISRLKHNFWKMSSTYEANVISDIERKQLSWWNPISDSTILTYAGFYNEFSKDRIVNAKKFWTGRLVLQVDGM
jgi:hypothetical protein